MFGKILILRGSINGNDAHFVTWEKTGNDFVYFDGIETNGDGLLCKPETHASFIKQKYKYFMIMGVFYKVAENEYNENILHSPFTYVPITIKTKSLLLLIKKKSVFFEKDTT